MSLNIPEIIEPPLFLKILFQKIKKYRIEDLKLMIWKSGAKEHEVITFTILNPKKSLFGNFSLRIYEYWQLNKNECKYLFNCEIYAKKTIIGYKFYDKFNHSN